MNIALLDVDGHHYPNLALMKISRWHKSHGDHVEFYDSMFDLLRLGHSYVAFVDATIKWMED